MHKFIVKLHLSSLAIPDLCPHLVFIMCSVSERNARVELVTELSVQFLVAQCTTSPSVVYLL